MCISCTSNDNDKSAVCACDVHTCEMLRRHTYASVGLLDPAWPLWVHHSKGMHHVYYLHRELHYYLPVHFIQFKGALLAWESIRLSLPKQVANYCRIKTGKNIQYMCSCMHTLCEQICVTLRRYINRVWSFFGTNSSNHLQSLLGQLAALSTKLFNS